MPTLGAVILFMGLATWIGWQAVQTDRADERIAIEARQDSCRRGNLIRASQHDSNLILSGLLETLLEPQRPAYLRARAALVRYVADHPGDVPARFSLEATRPNVTSRRAVEQAQALLARQNRLLAPVDCESPSGDIQ